MSFDRNAVVKMILVPLYIAVATLVWWGNADLPLEFHDREMFADHERIDADYTFFFSPDKAQYNGRWLANAYQWIVYWLSGENSPSIYRFLALLLHGVNTALLVRLVLMRGNSPQVAHGAGLWFLASPGHYQVIHHISAVDYILCALFGLWALLRVVRRQAWDGVSVLGLVCAALSHQSGVVFAALCWTVVYRGRWRAGWIAAVAVVGGAAALWFSLPAATSGGGAATALSSLLSCSYAWEIAESLVGLVGRLLAFAFFFPLPPNSASAALIVLGAIVLCGFVWLAYRRHPAWPWAVASMALLGPFALLINEFLAGLVAGPIRYLYLGSAFFFVALSKLLEPLGKRLFFLCVGAGLIASLAAWPAAREMTRASAAWAAADGHEEEALALYLSLWQSELLPPEYVEEVHENGLILAVGRREDFGELLARARARYPQNHRIGLVAASLEVIEDPAALARHAPDWAADPQGSLVVGSVLYRLFRNHARRSETGKMYAALVLSQAVSPRAHTERALDEVRQVLARHGKLDSIHANYIKTYGLASP